MCCFLQETSARPDKKAVAKKAKVEKAQACSVFKVSSSQQPRCQKAAKPKSVVEDTGCGPVVSKWACSKLILNKGKRTGQNLEIVFEASSKVGNRNHPRQNNEQFQLPLLPL